MKPINLLCSNCGEKNETKAVYCSNCGQKLEDFQNQPALQKFQSLASQIESSASHIDKLEARFSNLETQVKKIEVFLVEEIPASGIMSDSFIKRSFTVWGHVWAAQLILIFSIYIIVFVLALLAR